MGHAASALSVLPAPWPVVTWRRPHACLAAGLALCPAASRAASFTAGGDVQIRWDTTVRTSLGLRLDARDPALLADPNADDGDRAFAPGPVSERLDVLAQLDISQGALGFDASGDGWYDFAYHGRDANDSPGTFNPVDVPHDRFSPAVRALQGDTVELLSASVHDRITVWGLPVRVRVGRQTLLWGESLFSTENGIAAGQAPVDVIKGLSQPLATARELFLPVAEAVASVQLRPGVDVEAYVQPEWRRDRLPGVASYFSSADFLDVGGQRLFVGGVALNRVRDRTPSGSDRFGVALHVSSGGTDLGLYALQFDARAPQVFATAGGYGLIFPRGIQLYGASFSGYLGDSNVAGEISFRHREPLLSRLPAPGGGYAVGETLHAQASIINELPPARLWQGASLAAELTANDRLAITRNPAALAPTLDRFATALRLAFTAHYYEVLPQLELNLPIGFGLNLLGDSSVPGGGQAHTGDLDAGLTLTYRTVWQAALAATHFIGAAGRQRLGDRDFLTVSLARTF